MKEYKIGEVFIDSENFYLPKRLKCVEDGNAWGCFNCVYDSFKSCENKFCTKNNRVDNTDVHFIETDEPCTE